MDREFQSLRCKLGENFLSLPTGNDPLQKYGRHLHALEPEERSKIDEIVWDETSTGAQSSKPYFGDILAGAYACLITNRTCNPLLTLCLLPISTPIFGLKKNGCDSDLLDFPATTIFEVIFGSQTRLTSFAHDENRFVRTFEELKDNGFIEILDAWSAEAQKGIAHTRENMPLREGEIVDYPRAHAALKYASGI